MDLLEKKQFSDIRHPWEISRRASLLSMLRKYPPSTQYADIGCGDLFFSEGLCAYTDRRIFALDKCSVQNKRGDKIIQTDNPALIPDTSIDIALLLDVLEHAEKEDLLLTLALRITKDQGLVLITVPAYQGLFSHHDTLLQHYRRYTRKSLIPVLEAYGFQVCKSFYFYFTPLLVRFVNAILERTYILRNNRTKSDICGWKFSQDHIITKLLVFALNVEFQVAQALSSIRITIPGLSLFILCKKKSA